MKRIRVATVAAVIIAFLSTISIYADTGGFRARLDVQLEGNQNFLFKFKFDNFELSSSYRFFGCC